MSPLFSKFLAGINLGTLTHAETRSILDQARNYLLMRGRKTSIKPDHNGTTQEARQALLDAHKELIDAGASQPAYNATDSSFQNIAADLANDPKIGQTATMIYRKGSLFDPEVVAAKKAKAQASAPQAKVTTPPVAVKPAPAKSTVKPPVATSKPTPAPVQVAAPTSARKTITATEFAKPRLEMSREEFNKMTPAEKSKYCLAGNKIS